MAELKAEFRLSTNEATGDFALVVRYHSEHPSGSHQHEEEHRRVLDAAYRVLENCGFRPEQLSHVRIHVQTVDARGATLEEKVLHPLKREHEIQG